MLLGEGTEAALAEIEAGGVVLADRGAANAYRFHHALVHDVVYDSLLEVDRRHLHGEVGARLEAQHAGREVEVAEDLARHFEAAGDTRSAARYAYLAGTKALDLFALRDAETWYGKCLSFASSEGDTEDDLLFARTVVNQTQVLCWNGDFPAMVGLAQRHLPRIRALGAIEEVSRALTWIGEGYMHVGRYEDARATLGQALESGRALGDENCIGYASGELMWLDTVVGEDTDYDSLPDRATELEALAGRVGDRYLTTLAHYARWAHATQNGRIGVALKTARRMRAHGEHSSYPPAVCWGACLEADGHAKAGNADEAEQAARAGREVAACRFDHLMADLALGMTLVTIGRTEDGLALLKKAPWRTDRIGALYFAYAGDVAFGRALAAAGQVKEGLDWLRDGIVWFERIGNRRAACMAALELARILIEDANHPGPRKGLRLRLRALIAGATSPFDEARVCLDQVLAARQDLSMHDACAEALMLRARLAERDQDLATARAALTEAHALAASLEWLPLEQRINTEIRRLGAKGDQ
jgi:tetratricopeptide (TPR) repeat protein